MDQAWIEAFARSVWLLPALFLLVVGDAFLVVLPSETVVVALAALWAATGSPAIGAVVAVAAAGAIVGDSLCFAIGRRVGVARWRWQRRGRMVRMVERARATIRERPAALIFTARYIPFARIAVNLTAGASGLSYRRFLPLSAAAGTAWALYNCAIGAFFGTVLGAHPILAVAISIVVAITLGVLVDSLIARLTSIRRRRNPRSG